MCGVNRRSNCQCSAKRSGSGKIRRAGRRDRRRRAPWFPGSAGGRRCSRPDRRAAALSSRNSPCRRRRARLVSCRHRANPPAWRRARSTVWKQTLSSAACANSRGPGGARQPEQRAARLGPPIGRAQADEGRHQHDLLRWIGGCGKRAGFLGALHDVQIVAQPLHRRAGDEDRAFERVGAHAAELIGDGGEKLVLRGDRRRAGIEQGKTAGAVSRLDHARRETGLPDERRLLVAGHAADRDRARRTTRDRS